MKTMAESAEELRKAWADLFEVSGLKIIIVKCLDFITDLIKIWLKKSK